MSGFGRGGGFGGSDRGPLRGGDIESDLLVTLHEALNGAIRQLSLRRVDPKSAQEEADTFRVRIPRGATEGRLIRVPGKGQAGLRGGSSGDLFLRVRLARHPDFRVKGHDLFYDLQLAPWEVVLGAAVRVPTLDGSVNLKIPAGSQTGQQLRVRERGLPAEGGTRGDLYAVLSVVTPSQIDADEAAVWRQLAEKSPFNPRRSA